MSVQNISSMTQATQTIKAGNDRNVMPAAAPLRNATPHPAGVHEVAQTETVQADNAKPTTAQLQSAVETINKTLKQSNRNLEFSLDTDTKKLMVKLIDTETGDVVRQFPSEEMMAISRSIDRIQQGFLLKQKA